MCDCEQKHIIVENLYGAQQEPLKIELDRGQKGTYGWSITARGSDMAEVLSRLRAADAALRHEYATA